MILPGLTSFFEKFLTEGILLNEIKSDPLLNQYSAIVIDEVHERSINIDLILRFLKDTLQKRPDLRVIIASATIELSLFL